MTDSSNIWVTPKVKIVAKMLINDLHIRDGDGLASLLNISPTFSNFESVELWVQQRFSTNYDHFSDYEALRRTFVGNIPGFLQGEDWS
ncbi:hypothetical protein [Marinomonas communis]|uniref:Uncharacterized protein n=1 Tax=Marinomonas communis TaxID=28254 RepID=A0A4V3DG19_9GAMM|nr:hypothetical protein [Marinomonas communis]TDR12471.1 hypothetical protein C8D85_2506 [Marinomonas communis]